MNKPLRNLANGETDIGGSAIDECEAHERPWITVDRTDSVLAGSVWMSSQSFFRSPVPPHVYARRLSLTPNARKRVNDSDYPGACMSWQTIAVGTHPESQSRTYMVWRSNLPDCKECFSAAHSDDGGASFTSFDDFPGMQATLNYEFEECGEVDDDFRDDTLPYSVVAASSNPNYRGRAAAVWLNSRFSTPSSPDASPDADVVLTRTSDGGETWEDPIRVNDDPAGKGVMQDRPWATYIADGLKLFVAWRDWRNDLLPQEGQCPKSDLYVACSKNNGYTWVTASTSWRNQRLSTVSSKTTTNSLNDGFLSVAASESTGTTAGWLPGRRIEAMLPPIAIFTSRSSPASSRSYVSLVPAQVARSGACVGPG